MCNMSIDGETQAWEKLQNLDGERVADRASVEFHGKESCYTMFSYGQELHVDLKRRLIAADSTKGCFLLEELSSYSVLGILYYLAEAKDILPTGTMVSPKELPGGDIFQRGTHRLPMNLLTDRFGKDGESFLLAGLELGGERTEVGDAGCTLFPFPRVPVTAALWRASEEFSAEAVILFDSTCSFHLATDVIWATAMMTLGMLAGEIP